MEAKIKESFAGPYAEKCRQFIQYKRSLGYKYEIEEKLMKSVDRLSLNYKISNNVLSKEIVCDWIKRKDNESCANQKKRIYLIRQFGLYLQKNGFEAYVIPIEGIKKSKSSFVPYIFSDDEMLRLIKASDELPVSKRAPNKRLVMSLILRVLYGCGLRISEALNLNVEDVNLKTAVITVKESKNDNSRLVPMSDSLLGACSQYVLSVHKNSDSKSPFFANRFNDRYSQITIYWYFRKLLNACGIYHGGRGKGPRLHDIRHVFAINCLNKLSKAGIDLYVSLPILSTYLGHKSIEGTEKYLRLTASVYPEIIKNMEEKCKNIFPEVLLDEK